VCGVPRRRKFIAKLYRIVRIRLDLLNLLRRVGVVVVQPIGEQA
jgi:hypothetical protein